MSAAFIKRHLKYFRPIFYLALTIVFVTSEPINWVLASISIVLTVFSIGTTFFPGSPFFKKIKLNQAKAEPVDFNTFYDSNGNFQFYDWGFVKIIGKEEFILEWDKVRKITVYKRDLLTEDQICPEIETVDDIVFTTSEDTEGWFQLIKKLQKEFPAVNEKNIMKIAHPAFERNETILFSR